MPELCGRSLQRLIPFRKAEAEHRTGVDAAQERGGRDRSDAVLGKQAHCEFGVGLGRDGRVIQKLEVCPAARKRPKARTSGQVEKAVALGLVKASEIRAVRIASHELRI